VHVIPNVGYHRAMQILGATLSKKLAATLAVAVLLGQFALVLHDAVAQHELDTSCEICVIKDRHADFMGAGVAIPAFISIAAAICFFSAAVPAFRRIQAAHPRGPPTL